SSKGYAKPRSDRRPFLPGVPAMTALTPAERSRRYRQRKRDATIVTMQMVRDAVRDGIKDAIPIIVQQVIEIVTSRRDGETVTSRPLDGPSPLKISKPLSPLIPQDSPERLSVFRPQPTAPRGTRLPTSFEMSPEWFEEGKQARSRAGL